MGDQKEKTPEIKATLVDLREDTEPFGIWPIFLSLGFALLLNIGLNSISHFRVPTQAESESKACLSSDPSKQCECLTELQKKEPPKSNLRKELQQLLGQKDANEKLYACLEENDCGKKIDCVSKLVAPSFANYSKIGIDETFKDHLDLVRFLNLFFLIASFFLYLFYDAPRLAPFFRRTAPIGFFLFLFGFSLFVLLEHSILRKAQEGINLWLIPDFVEKHLVIPLIPLLLMILATSTRFCLDLLIWRRYKMISHLHKKEASGAGWGLVLFATVAIVGIGYEGLWKPLVTFVKGVQMPEDLANKLSTIEKFDYVIVFFEIFIFLSIRFYLNKEGKWRLPIACFIISGILICIFTYMAIIIK